jgi:phosphoglycerate dehydrogenase-like enzyme
MSQSASVDRPLTVLVTGTEINPTRLEELRQIAPAADIRHYETPAELQQAPELAEAEIVASALEPDSFRRAARLKWLHSWAAGPNTQIFPELVESPVVLTCCKSNGAIPLAEHAMMLMIMLNRDAMGWIEAQRERRWASRPHGELNNLTCGIIGTGYSGQDLALKCKAFHMRVLGLRRRNQPTPNFDRMYTRDELHDFLKASDFVVVTAPRTPETEGMLGEAEFKAMKPTAYYICFSRGGIADDTALLKALQEGWIAGAGLDAHDTEPLPSDSPFWAAPNTIVTPHNGASTPFTRERGYHFFRDNLRHYLAGEPLVNVVDKHLGY